MPAGRYVDVAVRVDDETAEVDGAETVVRPGHDYGTFKARLRDFDTTLAIELKTDALISERGMNPDEASSRTRSIFNLIAIFSVTCDEKRLPEGFNTTELMQDMNGLAIPFFLAYAEALVDAEERFRQGPPKAAKVHVMG